MDLQIIDFVGRARAVFEKNHELFYSPFGTFPRNSCGPASEILGQCLQERFNVAPVRVLGDMPDRPNHHHAWLDFDDAIVDVTHDQFTDTGLDRGRWVFCPMSASSWHASFRNVERHPLSAKENLKAQKLEKLYLLALRC